MICPLENETEIIKRCQTGDLRAFELIYMHFKEPLYRTAFRMLGSKEETEDALQTTFIKIYRGIKNFKSESRLSTYLFQILLNVCYDLNRSRKTKIRQSLNGLDLFYRPQNELQLQLEEAIQQLPEKMRECFVLFAIEGFKQQEIAELVNVTVGTVKAHIYQAKVKLRQILTTL